MVSAVTSGIGAGVDSGAASLMVQRGTGVRGTMSSTNVLATVGYYD